jgi:alpha-D-ribose 1-methylphosphonate 5-triphosphate synthase subunit PhnH
MRTATRSVRGFGDPVHDSQRTFRSVLDAVAHPGRVVTVAGDLMAIPPLHRASAALLLALADFETPVWLSPTARTDAVAGFLRFHCGCPLVETASRAAFVVAAIPSEGPALSSLDIGSDLYPERAATVILQVDGLGAGPAVTLTGSGIDGRARLACEGLDDSFWNERKALEILFPRGLDIILVDGDAIAAIPRSSCVEA